MKIFRSKPSFPRHMTFKLIHYYFQLLSQHHPNLDIFFPYVENLVRYTNIEIQKLNLNEGHNKNWVIQFPIYGLFFNYLSDLSILTILLSIKKISELAINFKPNQPVEMYRSVVNQYQNKQKVFAQLNQSKPSLSLKSNISIITFYCIG